jgi:hypothetical protein
MKTPDGKEFKSADARTAIRAAAGALRDATATTLRGAGKVIITIWRLAAALDSALWRRCWMGRSGLPEPFLVAADAVRARLQRRFGYGVDCRGAVDR